MARLKAFYPQQKQQRVDIALAYAASSRENRSIPNTYLTNDAARQSFRANVPTLCASKVLVMDKRKAKTIAIIFNIQYCATCSSKAFKNK